MLYMYSTLIQKPYNGVKMSRTTFWSVDIFHNFTVNSKELFSELEFMTSRFGVNTYH